MTDLAHKREAILTALERLLEWPEITRSPQLARFLDYIVRRTLDGDETSIKAYSIAVDVFGRGADFDPQADPIVRVQARRLRALLETYYTGPGRDDPTQIRLPVGRYVPDFVFAGELAGSTEAAPEAQAKASTKSATSQLPLTWYALALIAVVAATTAYAISSWGPGKERTDVLQRPSVTVVEFQNLAPGGSSPPQVAGLAVELVTDLDEFQDLTVRYGGGGEANAAMPNLPASDFVLTGIVRLDDAVMQYSAILTESRSSSVVWNQTLAVPVLEAMSPQVLDKVSRSLSLVLGSPRGPLHAPARQMLAKGMPLAGMQNSYMCRVLYGLYRESGKTVDAEQASACYAGLPEIDRGTPVALAASAILKAEMGVAPPADREATAQDMLDQAILLDPTNGFVWEQQARLHELEGQNTAALTDFSSSIQLNPANGDGLASFARLLALGGHLAEAEAMAHEALSSSPNPPAYYFGVPALLALRDRNFDAAREWAEHYAQSDRELGPILAVMAAQGSGNTDVVNRFLPQVLDHAAFRASGIMPRLRQRISDDALLEAVRDALARAGVPEQAMEQGAQASARTTAKTG